MLQPISIKPDILIITTTEVEQDAVCEIFKAATCVQNKLRGPYIDLGIIGDARIWMVISGMGSGGLTGSTLTLIDAIRDTDPQVVIMVGIAFGVNEQKQHIGDILISKEIVPYDNQRVGKDGIELRGLPIQSSENLLKIFRAAAIDWKEDVANPKVQIGSILSGDKLVDNLEYRDSLKKLVPGAIGGEMEGAGLCDVAQIHHKNWILVKSICDWADGDKSNDKDNRQSLAAKNAARFTLYVLKNKDIIKPKRTIIENTNKISLTWPNQGAKLDKVSLKNRIKEVDRGLSCTNYILAVEKGEAIVQEIGKQFEQDDIEIELILGEFWVSYSLALIYSGETLGDSDESTIWLNRVIDRFEKRKSLYLKQDHLTRRQFLLVLGRAYNHLGYSYWMDRGHYEAALGKFLIALEYFCQGNWMPETATVYDNLARVYAQLGFRSHAEFLCKHGLSQRERYYKNKTDEKENQYRFALSLNSSAIIQLTYGHSIQAYWESGRALTFFKQCITEKGERGEGLAVITKGTALRVLGSHWIYADNTTFSADNTTSCDTYLQLAINNLLEAEKIFIRVNENIRLLQIYNELGCAHREFYKLYINRGQDADADEAKNLAMSFFNKIVPVEKNTPIENPQYPLIFIDTCHDLAQTIYIVLDKEDSSLENEEKIALEEKLNEYLNRAENIIHQEYKFDNSSHPVLTAEECIEDFWQYLGKIYILRGDLVWKKIPALNTDAKIQAMRQEKIEEAFKFYLLAAAYFGIYLDRPISPNNNYYPKEELQELEKNFQHTHNLYERLSVLSNEERVFVRDKVCKNVIKEYNLKSSWIDLFFKQSFNLLIRKSAI
jgi:nucleoside phosphorylase